ncbi:MAG: hypothetical protein QFX33_01740 [Candidatus Nezhaarchaeota archaeon]|nr:hypothetical protein [Candidatus Nezhaarchaeota archaeon]
MNRYLLPRIFGRKFKVPVYVNFGRGRIEVKEVKIGEGECTVFDATRGAYEVEFFPSDEASGHRGAVIIAIEGVRANLHHSWVFYLYDESIGGWTFPDTTCDKVKLRKGNAVCWRYYNHVEEGFPPRRPPLSRGCARLGMDN